MYPLRKNYHSLAELLKCENLLSFYWWWSLPRTQVQRYQMWLLVMSNTQLHSLPLSGTISAPWTNCLYTMSPAGPWSCEGNFFQHLFVCQCILNETDNILVLLLAFKAILHTRKDGGLYILAPYQWILRCFKSEQPRRTRWSGDVMKRPGHKNFNAISHNRSRPEVLFLNLTLRSWGQISSVLLQLLLFAFSNRKFGRYGKWSVAFWQWENNT